MHGSAGTVDDSAHGGAQGEVPHPAAEIGEGPEGLAGPAARLGVALAHYRGDDLLEEGRLALGERLVHPEMARFQAVAGQVPCQPEEHEVVAVVPAPPLAGASRADQPERLQL